MTRPKEQPTLTLRPYQAEGKSVLENLRQEGRKRALVHLATGLGKTALAATDALNYQAAASPGSRILFVSHMNDVNTQAKDTFKRVQPKVNAARYHSGAMPTTPVVFATFQSLYPNLASFKPEEFDYIIWDEAHHIEATTFKAVREHFQPKFELGLTATPTRADGLDILDYFGEPVYAKGLAEGIAEGWLSAVDYHIVLDDTVKEAVEQGFDAKTTKDIQQLFSIRVRNEVIAENVKERRHNIGMDSAKTIVFCQNRQAAEEMAVLLGGRAYHSGVYAETRHEIMADFRNGNLQVICTVDMFNEGVDIPDAKLVVFLRSTSSRTIFEQQLGRGLRRAEGKNSVTVLDFVANIERLDFVNTLSHSISKERALFQGTDRERHDNAYIGPGAFQAHINQEELFASNFVFEDSTIELLERFNQLRVLLPEGYISTSQLAAELHFAHPTLLSFAKSRGLKLKKFRSERGKPQWGWSPEQAALARDLYAGTHAVVENAKSLYQLSEEWNTPVTVVKRLCQEAGVTVQKRRISEGKREGWSLTGQEADSVRDLLERGGPPHDYMAWRSMVQLLNNEGRKYASRVAREEMGIMPWRWNAQDWYSPTEVQKITARYPKKGQPNIDPERVVAEYKLSDGNTKKVAEQFGVSTSLVYRILKGAGIHASAKAAYGQTKFGPLPKGYLAASQVAGLLHTKSDVVNLYARKAGLKIRRYKVDWAPIPTIGYSPTQVMSISENYDVLTRQVREDVLSLRAAISRLTKTYPTLRVAEKGFINICKLLDIAPQTYVMRLASKRGAAQGITLDEFGRLETWLADFSYRFVTAEDMRQEFNYKDNRHFNKQIKNSGVGPTLQIGYSKYFTLEQRDQIKDYMSEKD